MSNKSVISQIIAKHNLQPGDRMRNVKDEVIEDSIVIDRYTVVYRDEDRYEMISERPIQGDEMRQSFSVEAFAVLKSISF